jgi:hypothetical protein
MHIVSCRRQFRQGCGRKRSGSFAGKWMLAWLLHPSRLLHLSRNTPIETPHKEQLQSKSKIQQPSIPKGRPTPMMLMTLRDFTPSSTLQTTMSICIPFAASHLSWVHIRHRGQLEGIQTSERRSRGKGDEKRKARIAPKLCHQVVPRPCPHDKVV